MPKDTKGPIIRVRMTLSPKVQNLLLSPILSKSPLNIHETYGTDMILTVGHVIFGKFIIKLMAYNETAKAGEKVPLHLLKIEEVDVDKDPVRITFRYNNLGYKEETIR